MGAGTVVVQTGAPPVAQPTKAELAMMLYDGLLAHAAQFNGSFEDLAYIAEMAKHDGKHGHYYWMAQHVYQGGRSCRLNHEATELLRINRFPVRVMRDAARAKAEVAMAFAGYFESHLDHALAADAWNGSGNEATEVEIRVYRPPGYVATYAEGVLQRLQRLGWRPADMAEHTAFAATYPTVVDRRFSFVALGSHWKFRNDYDGRLVAISEPQLSLNGRARWNATGVGQDWQRQHGDWSYGHGSPPEALFLAVVPPGTPPTPLELSE